MPETKSWILVVDDNDAERYFVARVLSRAGFRVREAATGSDALTLVSERPDLVTLDVRLPDINGFEICRRIKSDVATRDIPVLHISASFTTPDARVEGLEGGADGYLVHPVEPTELVATVRALLRARIAESQVRAAARDWTATFDLIGDPICLTGRRGEILRCNHAFARLADRAFPQLIGQSLGEVLPGVQPLVAAAAGIHHVRVGDRDFRLSVERSAEGNGISTARAWIFADVTERERQAAALRQSQEEALARAREIEAVYDAAPVGLCVIDRELRYVRVNRRLAAFHGLPVEAHAGRTVREVVPDLADALEPTLREVFETGRPVAEFEVAGATGAEPGAPRRWSHTLHPLVGADDRVFAVNVVVEDITERRRLAARILEAQRLEAVGRLAGGVAHETNNQMTVVLGCTTFALRNPATPDSVRVELEQIQTAAERTARITAQLLAFGRQQPLRLEAVELDGLIGRLRPILERALGPGPELRLELAAPRARVHADVGQLEQVLLNLTLNARDAMPQGGTLTVRTAVDRVEADPATRPSGDEPLPGRYIRLTVEDTGEGMTPETLAHAFEPFFTTKEPGKGTGLGLSMVYGIVKQSGGHVQAWSAPDRGTRFDIHLPLMETGADVVERPAAPEPAAVGGHVLLVEDDPLVRAVIARELAASGFTVAEAADGRVALELVAGTTRPFDVVITDLAMPRMGGSELAAALAQLAPALPVLVMSGHPDDVAKRQLLDSGRPFLQKPFGTLELLSRLREIMPPTRRA